MSKRKKFPFMLSPAGFTIGSWKLHLLRCALHDKRRTLNDIRVNGMIPASRAGVAMKLRVEIDWITARMKQLAD